MVYLIESVGIAAMRRKIPDSFSIISFKFYSDIGILVGQNSARWFWARNLARCFWARWFRRYFRRGVFLCFLRFMIAFWYRIYIIRNMPRCCGHNERRNKMENSTNYIGNCAAFLIFTALVISAPILIQTEFWIDNCGMGFLNGTFGGYYFETGCK